MQNHDSILETIFSNAVRMENEDERASYIKVACGDDSSKLSELQSMLRDYSAAGAMFDRPAAVAPTLAAESTSYISRQIGPYKLRELLGEGGMGSVYVAEQEKPVRRKVALKGRAVWGHPSTQLGWLILCFIPSTRDVPTHLLPAKCTNRHEKSRK